MKAIFVLKG
ncbi:hypothetical protein MLP92_018420 [Escherichia coli]|nr:hypothetical protein [Escherichia coli]MCV1598386.1 hypothetical protein [Escherichia coli]